MGFDAIERFDIRLFGDVRKPLIRMGMAIPTDLRSTG